MKRVRTGALTAPRPDATPQQLAPTQTAQTPSQHLEWRYTMDGNIFNTKGKHVGSVIGSAIFDLSGKKLYELKGIRIYRLSGELVGHLNRGQGSENRLNRATEKLFQ
jgi:hypothetical protein